MPAEVFFPYAAELMKANKPKDVDWSQVERIKRLGIIPGQARAPERAAAARGFSAAGSGECELKRRSSGGHRLHIAFLVSHPHPLPRGPTTPPRASTSKRRPPRSWRT